MKHLLKKWVIAPIARRITPKIGFALGIALTLTVVYWAIPEVTTKYTNLMEKLNPPVMYARAETPVATSSPEKLEQYYQEELKAQQEKFKKAHENAARTTAIERLEADLEAEKELLRESELLQ